jgi:NAD(P)H-flavin reductase
MSPHSEDLYLPIPAEIIEIIEENSQIKTFSVRFVSGEYHRKFNYRPGQFMMVSIPHCGEAPISISSSPALADTFHLSVRRAGKLTEAMHGLKQGDVIGLRGPYGKSFTIDNLLTKDLLFVAGGIGLAPLRSVINTCLTDPAFSDHKMEILYGSRTPLDIAFKTDLDAWQKDSRVECRLTVDLAEEGWKGAVGLVTSLLAEVKIEPTTSAALVCGPPLMIRAVLAELSLMGFSDENIITTLERYMKCGVGICRHCHMDSQLVCKDGPVYSLSQLKKLNVPELAP